MTHFSKVYDEMCLDWQEFAAISMAIRNYPREYDALVGLCVDFVSGYM